MDRPMIMDKHRTLWQVRSMAGEPWGVIQVRDLQSTTRFGNDAWGRRGKEQPLLITAEIQLPDTFVAAGSDDCVRDDTIHYGILAKGIQSSLKRLASEQRHLTLGSALKHLLEDVTYSDGSGDDVGDAAIFLDSRLVRYSGLTMTLPKASLRGEGVSLSHHRSRVYSSGEYCWTDRLRLHNLRVPTLIGVNANEREAKQIVVADIRIDFASFDLEDIYTGAEAVVVNVMEQSSFETLEALAMAIASELRNFLCFPGHTLDNHFQIKIALEKPTAVPMAQAARVEHRLSRM